MELGSEFNLDISKLKIVRNSLFKYIGDMNYCLFDSGRNALKAIAEITDNGYILMPEYICESVLRCFPNDKIIFYKLKESLLIDQEDLINKISDDTAIVYLMHYFGSLQPKNVLLMLMVEKKKYGFTIIEDTTHSFFSRKQTVGDYCVASLRKWFPIPNGGVLYSDNVLFPPSYNEVQRSTDNEKTYAMMLKTLYLSEQLDCNAVYRKIFTVCENNLDTQQDIKKISDFSEFILGCLDIDEIVKKRKANLYYIKSNLKHIGIEPICNFDEGDCPFTLPVTVPNRDYFRQYLADNKIYCAVHWPFDGRSRSERPLAWALSNNMVSLPIDQRYGEAEMDYLLKVITSYKGR